MTTMSGILGNITSIVSSSVTWAGQFVTFITSNPLVLLCVLIVFIGTGIGILKRVMNV